MQLRSDGLLGVGRKTARRDAEDILELLLRNESPCVHCQSAKSRQVWRQLRYRQGFVKINVMIKNNLYAIPLGAELSLQTQLSTNKGQEHLESVPKLESGR
jgi:hypothetical protein